MECPYCEQELNCVDYFGRVASHQDGHVEGDIYKCGNEDCEMFDEHFHTHRNNESEVHEGYPC